MAVVHPETGDELPAVTVAVFGCNLHGIDSRLTQAGVLRPVGGSGQFTLVCAVCTVVRRPARHEDVLADDVDAMLDQRVHHPVQLLDRRVVGNPFERLPRIVLVENAIAAAWVHRRET